MNKYDQRFQASVIFALSLLMSTAASFLMTAPRLSAHFADEHAAYAPATPALMILSVLGGLLAFQQYAASKALTSAWACAGLSLVSPVLAIGSWILLMSQRDENPSMVDELMGYEKRQLQQLESGSIKVQFASDMELPTDSETAAFLPWDQRLNEIEDVSAWDEIAPRVDPRNDDVAFAADAWMAESNKNFRTYAGTKTSTQSAAMATVTKAPKKYGW